MARITRLRYLYVQLLLDLLYKSTVDAEVINTSRGQRGEETRKSTGRHVSNQRQRVQSPKLVERIVVSNVGDALSNLELWEA